MKPILESPETARTVASVASSSLVADEVEQEREALRRTGAIPKRLANRGRQERNPRQLPVDSPASPDGNPGGEGGATSEEERSSRAAAKELRDYLATGPVEPPGEEPPRRPPSPALSAPLRSARQGPEGHEREPVFQDGMGSGGRDRYGCWQGGRGGGSIRSARGPCPWREKEKEEEEVEAVQPSATFGVG